MYMNCYNVASLHGDTINTQFSREESEHFVAEENFHAKPIIQ